MKRAVAVALLLGVALWWGLREPPGDPRLTPEVRKLIRQMASGSDDKRWEAILELSKQPPSPAVALALAPAVTDSNSWVRERAWGWLRQHADVSGDAIPLLVAALDHESNGARWAAAWALDGFGERAAPAVPALLRMLERTEDRFIALATLADVGPAALAAADAILAAASGPDRSCALRSLEKPWFPLERALPVLLERLTDSDRGVVILAARATLMRLARAPKDCGAPEAMIRAAVSTSLDELERLLDDEDIRVRLCAVEALGDLVENTGPEVVLAPMARALKHRHVDVRRGAAEHSAWRKDPGAAVRPLAEALLDVDLEVGPLAAVALGWLGPGAAPAGEALAHAIETRLHMVDPGFAALGRIGPKAFEPLVALLSSESPAVRKKSAELLAAAVFEPATAEAPPLTPVLVRALTQKEFVLKALSTGALERWGKEARAAVPALCEIFADAEQYLGTRTDALKRLEALGPDAAGALPALEAHLGSPDRQLVIPVLGALGPAAIPALTAIADHDPYPTMRYEAISALAKIGAPEVLKRALADADPGVRLAAALGLPDADALTVLEKLLDHPAPNVRNAVIASARPSLRPGIVRRLSSPGPYERAACLKALAAMGASQTLPRVAQLLGDPDADVRRAAIAAIVTLSPDPDHAARLLARILEEADPWVQSDGLKAVGRLASPEALALLRRATTLKESLGRRTAVEQLGELGPAASPALPELLKLLTQGDSSDQSIALAAIGKIGPAGADVVGAIVKRFATDGNSEASALIVAFTPAARDGVPALIQLLSSRHSWYREVAARGLAGIGPDAAPALGALARAALECESDSQRDALFGALRVLGPESIPALRMMLPQARPFERYDAAALLVGLEPGAEDGLKILREGIRNGDFYAVRALRWVPTPMAMPLLNEALKNSNPWVVKEAREALRKIESP